MVHVQEIRDFLEGYCITTTTITDEWIENRRDKFVVPYIEKFLNHSIESETTKTVYLSGKGRRTLILPDRDINELVSIEYVTGGDFDSSIGIDSVELIADEGVIRSVINLSEGRYNRIFAKGERNIKVVYKIGNTTLPDDISEAIIYLCCEQLLGFLGARTGGGSLTVQGFSRNYGERGKYQDIRNDLSRQAMAILKNHISLVTGDIM